jgi:hypothetical protein
MALGSTMWSIVPLFSFVRGLQLLIVVGLALLMTRIWLASPQIATELWRQTLRLFIGAVTVLVLIGLVVGWDERFTWPGTHPGVAAMFVGVGLVIMIAVGARFLGFRKSGYLFRLALFATALYLGQTRSVLGGVLVAVAVMLLLETRTKPLKGLLGVTYYATAIGLVVVTLLPQVLVYVYRGETTRGLESLNGRIPLWEFSIELVGDAHKWLTGFGYGSARLLLSESFSWAGTAHSAWVELFLSVGILGPLLVAVDILFVLRYALSRFSLVPPALTMSLLALLIITSITGEGLAFPSLAFVLLALLHVPVLTQRNSMIQQAEGDEAPSRILWQPSRTNGSGPEVHLGIGGGLGRGPEDGGQEPVRQHREPR